MKNVMSFHNHYSLLFHQFCYSRINNLFNFVAFLSQITFNRKVFAFKHALNYILNKYKNEPKA
jgi:hypothetical protein